MPYVRTDRILQHANNNNYCVGSFNIHNLETAQAVIEAAEQENAPILLQAWAGLFRMDWVNMETLAAMVKSLGEQAQIPVSLHLDHGETFEEIAKAVRAGFSSVMIDASQKELEENISLTNKVIELSHSAGVTVEAELGHVGNDEGTDTRDTDVLLTKPEEVEYFVGETDVDYLAISIGTVHGVYEAEPELDINRLAEIDDKVDIPLVLHGSSYLPDLQIKQAVENGINKINIATEIDNAMVKGIEEALDNSSDIPYANELTGKGKKKMVEVIKKKLNLFSSAGKVLEGQKWT